MSQVAPSLLAADFSALGQELQKLQGADMLHLDIMDGRFVPNLTMGPQVLAALRGLSPLFFDVHLMLEHPMAFVDVFRRAGADAITFHIESADPPALTLAAIQKSGARPGLALKPATSPQALLPYKGSFQSVTVMTVEPGFGGQKMLPHTLKKIGWIKENLPGVLVEVDGGVNLETAPLCREAGADVLVAGTAVFGAADPPAAIRALQG